MKYFIILLLLPTTVFCQNCAEKINAARKSKEAGNYEVSIMQFQAAAAAGCNIEIGVNIEGEILQVFKEIKTLKEAADRAKQLSDRATDIAVQAQKKAEIAKDEAENSRIMAEKAKKEALNILDSLNKFNEKSRILESTFSDPTFPTKKFKIGI